MIRAVVSSEDGKKPSYPKVTTYPDEKAADTESTEAQPEEGGKTQAEGMRTWNDATGAFSLEAKFVGVKDGKVMLKKANGKTVAVPLDRLSKEDQVFVAEQTKGQSSATTPTTPVARKARELSHDDGQSAGKSSMAGGGHAVKFKVDGDSYYVTSVSLYGSRYGMPQPPPENFRVWICDADFQPIATFRFPYSAYIRSNAVWKSFNIRATKRLAPWSAHRSAPALPARRRQWARLRAAERVFFSRRAFRPDRHARAPSVWAASCAWRSPPGGGTEVEVKVPLP